LFALLCGLAVAATEELLEVLELTLELLELVEEDIDDVDVTSSRIGASGSRSVCAAAIGAIVIAKTATKEMAEWEVRMQVVYSRRKMLQAFFTDKRPCCLFL
jgi:hypothetical protein